MKNLIFSLLFLISANILAQSTQCLGTTKSGNRCKNMTKNETSYCYLHEEQVQENKPNYFYTQPNTNTQSTNQNTNFKLNNSTQCTGTTQSGARCKRMTTNSSGRCYQH